MKIFILFFLFSSISIAAQENKYLIFSQKQKIAIRSEKWQDAIANTIGMINLTKDNNISASAFLQLGSLLWLSGNQSKAVSAINRSIHIMRYSSNVDASVIMRASLIRPQPRKKNRH